MPGNSSPLLGQQSQQSPSKDFLMSTFPVTKRKRVTRAKFAKVRTGCVTCKKRHVKCDETKPGCKNCLKWAGFCGGYEPIHTKPSVSSYVKRALIRIPSPDIESSSSPEELELPLPDYGWQFPTPETLSPPSSIDSQLSFDGAILTQSYDPYLATMSTYKNFDDLFWTFSFPRMLQDSVAIRHANQAVQSLILANSPSSAPFANFSGRNYYGEALTSYGLALLEARQATSPHSDLREAVVCCMFFTIFETLNGDHDAAQSHMQSGQSIMDELNTESAGTDIFRKEIQHVSSYLARQAHEFGLEGYNGLATDSPNVFDSLVF